MLLGCGASDAAVSGIPAAFARYLAVSDERKVDAAAEGFLLLKVLGYPIRPAEDEGFFTEGPKRKLWQAAMFVMCKTPLGRLTAADHCAHAVSEMSMLDRAWEELRAGGADASVNIPMPVWDFLRKSMPVERKRGRHGKIQSAYKRLGNETAFYDGMITCSTLPGKAVCKLVWDMDKKKNDCYLRMALSGIPEDFSGRMLEVPVGTGVLTMPVYETLGGADITCMDYSTDMMERAKRRAEKRGLKNVRFLQGDVGEAAFRPYETAGSLQKRLKAMYRKAEVKTVEGMAAFRCRKGKADAEG